MANSNTSESFPRILSIDGPIEAASGGKTKNPVPVELCTAFEAATGWTLKYTESQPSRKRRQQPGLSDSPVTGKLEIDDMSAIWPAGVSTAHRGKCDKLVESLDQFFSELQQSHLRMYAIQADLAANDATVVSKEDSYRLAELLASLLNSAAKSVGATSAAMYMLDDDTEWLAMRSSVGLEGKHAKGDQRLLATSVADIEAMAGNAIVMEDPTQCSVWSAPEQCGSAICIPIASMKTILGTLWVFSNEVRQYSDQELNLIEIIAGRIAAELEKEALLRSAAAHKTESTASPRLKFENYPVVDPPFDGWTMQGQAGWEDNKFVEWNVTDSEELRLTIGQGGNEQGDGTNASLFVDPLTGEFQVHGRVEGLAFWLLDRSTGQVFDICEWAGPLMLTNQQSLVATATDNIVLAQAAMNDFENGDRPPHLVLYLNRV